MSFNIDIAIVLSYLILTLYVGIRHSKGVKTIQDYALAGRNFNTVELVSTITATWVSGSLFFIDIERTFKDGWLWTLTNLGMAVTLLLTGLFIAPRMQHFLSDISIADSLGKIYGKKIRIIVAALGLISVMGIVAIQFKVFGRIFEYFLGWDVALMTLISGVVVISYSSLGGIRGVTFTDILQSVVFCFAIPFVTMAILDSLYFNEVNISEHLLVDKFNFTTIFTLDNPNLKAAFFMMMYFAIPGLKPAMYQRMLIGKSIKHVQKSFIISAVIFTLIVVSISWIAFLVHVSDPTTDPKHLIGHIITKYSTAGFQGMLISGVIAMVMSTADSHLNASSVLFAHDFCKPLKIGIKHELRIARLFVLVVGLGAIVLALSMDDLLKIILTTNSYYIPIVTVPMLLTIFGFRTTTKSIMIGMGAGFVSTIVWKFITVPIDGIVICMMINLVFLLGSHYLLKQEGGGWTHTKSEYLDEVRKERKRKLRKFLERLKDFRLLEFCKKHAPDNQFTYMWFGLYCIIYGISIAFSTHTLLRVFDHKIILHSYQLMVITGTMLAAYPIWPLSVDRAIKERIVQIWWNFAVFYMLFFFSIFFLLLTKLETIPTCYFVMNMLFAVTLVGWRAALIMLAIGGYLAIEFYKYTTGFDSIDLYIGSPSSVFIYVVGIITSGTIIFIKQYQDRKELAEQKVDYQNYRLKNQKKEIEKSTEIKNEFLRNIPHESNNALTPILGLINMLHENYDTFSEEERRNMLKYTYESNNKLESLVKNIFDLSKLSIDEVKLNKKTVNISDLVYDSIDKCRKLYIEPRDSENRIWNVDIDDNIVSSCDEYYISQAVDNLVINAIQYCVEGNIEITLKKEKLGKNQFIRFTMSDEGIGIPKDEIDQIFNPFTTSSKTRKIEKGRGIGLTVAQRAIKAHEGTISVKANKKKGSIFSFLLPV